MIRLVNEFLNKYFEGVDPAAFSSLDKKEPDVTVTAGGAIVTPDDESLPPAVYTYGKSDNHQFSETPEGLKTQAKQAARYDDATEVEMVGKDLRPLVYNDDVGDYISPTHDQWYQDTEVRAPYFAAKDAAIAKAAVNDYIQGKRSGTESPRIENAIKATDQKWSKELAGWKQSAIEDTDRVNQEKALRQARMETNQGRWAKGLR